MPHAYSPARFRRLLLVATLLISGFAANAKIWRVDNNGGSPGDFTSAQAANDGAAANDTLYFNGSGTGYGDVTFNKRLYIFGPGYFLSQNPQTQASLSTAYIRYVTLNGAAAGSLMTGMSAKQININVSNVLLKRNNVTMDDNCTQCVTVGAGVSNITITQNFINNTYNCNGNNRGVYVSGGCSNIIVSNNYIASARGDYDVVYSASAIDVTNNVLAGRLNVDLSSVTNNIQISGDAPVGSGTSYQNNFSNSTQFTNGGVNTGNQPNQNMATIFVASGSSDGQYQLAAASPAKLAGVNGEDVGMYGGSDPYVLSGLPAIPSIWFFSAPSSGSGAGGLQIRIKAKSNN